MQEEKLSAGAARYVDMEPAKLRQIYERVSAALSAVTALKGDASVFAQGQGRLLDSSRLPSDTADLLGLTAGELAAMDHEAIRLGLYLIKCKAGKALSIQNIRQGKEFTRASCQLLFDKKPLRGSLASLFSPSSRH